MTGELLTEDQRILWKRFEEHGDLAFMDDAELREWALVCDKLLSEAGPSPRMAPARELWQGRLDAALLALPARGR
jgi:hypothetical protein